MENIAEIQKDECLLAGQQTSAMPLTLPFGVQYYRSPTPLPDEWEKDINNISVAGYNLVQFRPQWRTHERIHGKFVWDDLDRLVELACEKNINFILKPMLECAPDWVYSDLNGYRVGIDERKMMPKAIGAFYVGGWLPCFDNPNVVSAATEFVVQLAERYSGYENLAMWNAWNEPRSRPLGECCCEHSVKAYRQYLCNQYKTIETLNQKFGKAWTDFERVLPPGDFRDYVDLWLWRQWAADAVAKRVKFVYDAIRSVDPSRRIMAHVGCSLILQDVVCDTSDDIQVSSVVDNYGCSMPVLNLPEKLQDVAVASMIGDWLRSVDNDWWCYELYPKWQDWESQTDPLWLRRLIWNVIACGTRGIMFWQYRSERVGNEFNGHGLRDVAGNPTPLSEVAEEIAEILANEPELKQCNCLQSNVAILYSFKDDMLNRITKISGELCDEKVRFDYFYKQAVQGAYMGLWMNDIRVDWVDTRSIEKIHIYKCLVVTAMEMHDSFIFEELKKFVHNGGTLIIEYPFACRSDNTWLLPERPSLEMQELLGIKEKFRRNITNDKISLSNGQTIPVASVRVEFDVNDAGILGSWNDGSAAITLKEYGQGKILCLGGSVSAWSRNAPASAVSEAWDAVFILADVKDIVTPNVCGGWTGLESRHLIGPDAEYLFIVNHVEQNGEITVRKDFAGGDLKILVGESFIGNTIKVKGGEIICCKLRKRRK